MSTRMTAWQMSCVVGVVVLLAGCASNLHIRQVTITDAADVRSFSTYRWQYGLLEEATSEERVDIQYTTVIQQTMDHSMQSLGYTRADDDESALILAFQLTIDDVVEGHRGIQASRPIDDKVEYGLQWRLPKGASPVKLGFLSSPDEVIYFSEGTLHVGAFAPDKSPLWHVMGHEIFDSSHPLQEHQVVLQKTVREIMQKFPSRQTIPSVPADDQDN